VVNAVGSSGYSLNAASWVNTEPRSIKKIQILNLRGPGVSLIRFARPNFYLGMKG